MPLYCSLEILQGLAGANFPASKTDLLEYAKQHDAPEAAVVMLNQLDGTTFQDVGDVCHNAGITCSIETADSLAEVDFPANRAQLVEAARAHGASDAVLLALEALPDGLPFGGIEDVCNAVLHS